MLYLSKSKYCNAVQCPKMLWLKKHKPEEFDDSVMNEAVLKTGNEVGDLAMRLLGEFTEVPYGDLSGMIATTTKLIEQGVENIAEASFSYKGLYCAVDILKNKGNKHVEIYEVKSSTSVHSIYYSDVSYQYYVLSNLGYTVDKVYLVHLNREYERVGELDLHKLFKFNDLTDVAKEKYVEVEQDMVRLEEYMKQKEEPEDDIGEKCFSPYNCGFFKYCTRDLPHPNIFDVTIIKTPTKFKNYYNNIISFNEIQQLDALKPQYMLQVDQELDDLPPHIEKDKIYKFMDKLSYPLYFLDFESFQPAIPEYDHTRTFDQIVFQYSLHYIEEEGGELKHKEYLAYPGEDPRRKLAESLVNDIPVGVCTTAYNMTFEKTRIKELANLYPDLHDHLMDIHDHIVDLMVPFHKRWYYTRAMQGSYSIKYVLPALFPDDPTLDYHNLEGVHNGGEASETFKQMATMDQSTLEEYRGHLLKYCGLDTYAMVKVWEKLKEATNN